jgi:hypothetical protein
MSGYLLRPCKSTAAFEALPEVNSKARKRNLDLNSCQEMLTSLGYEEVCDAKVLLILKKEIEVTIYPDGKLILKTDEKEIAEKVMNEIYNKILN